MCIVIIIVRESVDTDNDPICVWFIHIQGVSYEQIILIKYLRMYVVSNTNKYKIFRVLCSVHQSLGTRQFISRLS